MRVSIQAWVLVALLIGSFLGPIGCTCSKLGSVNEGPSFPAYRPAAGAWPDERANLPDDEWRKGLSGRIIIKDHRAHAIGERCASIGKYGVLGPCSSMPGWLAGPGSIERPIEELTTVARCALQSIPALPATSFNGMVEVVITAEGVVAKLSADTPRPSGLQSCVDAAARAYREKDADPGVIKVSFWIEYDRWCEQLPTGVVPGESSPPVEVRDTKNTPFFALHRAPFGYWLLSCQGPDSWQVRMADGSVEVVARSGEVASVGRRTAAGFTVGDVSGKVILSGTGERDRITLGVGNETRGELVSMRLDGGAEQAKLKAPTEPMSIYRRGDEWFVSVDGLADANMTGAATPFALLMLALPHVERVHQVAAFALLADWAN